MYAKTENVTSTILAPTRTKKLLVHVGKSSSTCTSKKALE